MNLNAMKVIADITTLDSVNVTEAEYEGASDSLILLYNILVILQVSLLMLSMGSGTDVKEIRRHIVNPKGPIVGIICQLVLMPFMTYCFAQALNVSSELAIGMVVVASCPGGAPANVFTLISRGNLSLSVCLTVFSSILALGTMPLNKMIYIRSWTDELPVIPYTNIIIAILTTWIPALVGIFVKYKWPKVGAKLTKIGGIVAFLVLLAFAFVQQFVYPGVFQLDWSVWFAAILLPTFGWVMGFGVATMFLFEIPERRAIAYGTSYVNGGLSLALITLSFGKSPETNKYILFPMLYTASQLVMAIVTGILHIIYFRMKERSTICHKLCGMFDEKKNSEESCQEVSVDNTASIQKTDSNSVIHDKSHHSENGIMANIIDSNNDSDKTEDSSQTISVRPPPYVDVGYNRDTQVNGSTREVGRHISVHM